MRTDAGRLRLLALFAGGLTLVILAAGSLPPWSYNRDLAQDYLGARALRDGLDPYTPLPDLSAYYFPVPIRLMAHPSMHPPIMFALSVPMSFLPFELVYCLAFLINVLLLVAIGRWLGLSVPGSLALSIWPPIWWVLFENQFEILILTLAMLGWRSAAGGHEWRAGVWLGLAGIFKWYPLVFLVPFAARRQIRVLLAAGAVTGLAQLVGVLVVGPAGLVRYFTEILPQVSAPWLGNLLNTSPYGALLRIFGGARDVEPILDLPWLPILLAGLFSVLGLVSLLRLPPQAAPLATLITLPNAWSYQVTVALPEIVRLLRLPRWRAGVLAAAAAASFIPFPFAYVVNDHVVWLTGWSGYRGPPITGLFGAVAAAGLVALVLISLRTGGQGALGAVRPEEQASGTVPPAPDHA